MNIPKQILFISLWLILLAGCQVDYLTHILMRVVEEQQEVCFTSSKVPGYYCIRQVSSKDASK